MQVLPYLCLKPTQKYLLALTPLGDCERLPQFSESGCPSFVEFILISLTLVRLDIKFLLLLNILFDIHTCNMFGSNAIPICSPL